MSELWAVGSRVYIGRRGADESGSYPGVGDGDAIGGSQEIHEAAGFVVPAVAGGAGGQGPLQAVLERVAPFEMVDAIVAPGADGVSAGGDGGFVVAGADGDGVAAQHDFLGEAVENFVGQMTFNGVLLGEGWSGLRRGQAAVGGDAVDEMAVHGGFVLFFHRSGEFVNGTGEFIQLVEIGVDDPVGRLASMDFQAAADLRLAVVGPAGEYIPFDGEIGGDALDLGQAFFHAFAEDAEDDLVDAEAEVVVEKVREEIDGAVAEDRGGEEFHIFMLPPQIKE